MFSAKKNTASAASSASKNQKKTPFIKPEMKVVKSDIKENEGAKENAKGASKEAVLLVAKQEKNSFFAPKKQDGAISKEVDKEGTETKTDQKSKLGDKAKGASKAAGASATNAIASNTAATQSAKAVQPIKPKEAGDAQKGKEEGAKKEKEGVKEDAAVEKKIPKAPTKPEDDPAFQAQIKATEKAKEEKSQHPDPDAKVGEQQAAGHAPAAAQSAKNDQEAHAGSMSATSEKEKEREPFTPESFKKLLEKNLDDLEKQLPKNSDEAKEFKDDKPIEGIKENISGQVTSESDKLAGPMKNEADKPAPAIGAPTLEAEPLPVADPGVKPKPLNAKAAIPKPKTSQEISMEKESQSLDDKMSENEVTDEQLAKSNEPQFTGALEGKNQAQTEAKLAPVRYRKKEEAQLGASQKNAATTSQEGLDQMQGAKVLSEDTVLANQTTNKTSDLTEKEKIYAEFSVIYEETKKAVTDSLEKLSEDVDKKFSEEAESAQKTFEKNVEDGLGDIYGFTVIDDWLFGEDTEAIDKLFRVEKSKFVSKMNSVLDDISIIIADGLNAALDAIADGKKKSKEKFDSLDESQKKLGEDAFADFNDQYADLEDTVYEKQEELAADLAQSYKENVDSLQEKFDTIKDTVSAGWIGAALNALVGVIKTILKIKDLLLNLLAAAVSAIGAIITDPIGFLSNLISGIKQGFVDFGNNIKKHMIKGLLEWLTGSLGDVGITLPDNLFSLSGIFNLVAQMLGLTWDYFRSKAVKHLGEPVVAGMEKAVEIFTIVKTQGVMGLWEYIKEQFGNLKEMVMDAIRDMIITKVIEAGIKWVMGLLSPAGAFVKAAMMIIDIVKFFVERAAQIFELVTAFVNSIKALAAGNVKAVAKGIEMALAKAIPVLISFLAALVGVTGLTGKIQKIIKKVRKKIDKAIDKIIKKAKKAFNKILGKKKPKKGDAKKIKDDNKKQKPDKLTAKDKAKHKKIASTIKKKLSEKAKKDESFEVFHKRKQKEAKSFENKYQPQLNKGINIDVTLTPLASDKKDNDVDFKIKIAPNNTTDSGSAAAGDAEGVAMKDKPKLLSWLNKKVVNKDGTVSKSFWKLISPDSPSNKYTLEGDKKEKTAYKIIQKKANAKSSDKLDEIKIGRVKAEKGLKTISITDIDENGQGGVLKEGAEKKYIAPHDKFIPQEIVLKNTEKGKYNASYETLDSAGKKGPTFEIEISYEEVEGDIPNKRQVRKVEAKNLSNKKSGVGRGKTDSASVFDNAHIIGDQFGGSGKNSSLNIHPSSADYNRKDMLNVENQMAAHFKKSDQSYDLTATATITDDDATPNKLKTLLEKEFNKDNTKTVKFVKDKQMQGAKDKLISTLQSAVNKDLKQVPAKFLSINYNSSGLDNDFKKNMKKENENDERTDKPTTEILAADKSINVGEDKGFEATKDKFLASKK